MKCQKCGASNKKGAKICTSCGHIIEGKKTNVKEEPIINKEEDLADDISKNKVMAVLCYLGIFIIIPYFQARNSKYVWFHLKQGVNLLVVYFISSVLWGFVNLFNALNDHFWGMNNILLLFITIPLSLFGLVTFILTLIGVINAVNGEMKKLPLIGNLNIIK